MHGAFSFSVGQECPLLGNPRCEDVLGIDQGGNASVRDALTLSRTGTCSNERNIWISSTKKVTLLEGSRKLQVEKPAGVKAVPP